MRKRKYNTEEERRAAQREHDRRYKEKNRELLNAKSRERYAKNKEKMKEYNAKRYNELKEYRKKWAQENSDLYVEYRRRHLNKREHKHCVYYLPQEHYVGVTKNIEYRTRAHRTEGRITDGYEIIAYFDNKRDALLFESYMHNLGFRGARGNSKPTCF